jgi:hypothetical protein
MYSGVPAGDEDLGVCYLRMEIQRRTTKRWNFQGSR